MRKVKYDGIGLKMPELISEACDVKFCWEYFMVSGRV